MKEEGAQLDAALHAAELPDPDTPSAEETAAASKPVRLRPAKGRVPGAASWLALLLIIVLAGAATSPWWAPPLATVLPWGAAGSSGHRLDAIDQRLAALEQRAAQPAPHDAAAAALDKMQGEVAALDQRLGGAEQKIAALGQQPQAGADNPALDRRLGQAEQKIAALEQRPQAGAEVATLRGAVKEGDAARSQLADRLSALEKKVAAAPDPAAFAALHGTVDKLGTEVAALRRQDGRAGTDALLLSLGQLRQAMAGSAPFSDALAAAAALAQGEPGVAAPLGKLKDVAAQGVPSVAALRAQFGTIAAKIADAAPEGGAGWLDRVRRGLGISVRPVGPSGAAGTGPAAAVARAETALSGGDLAAAVAALDGLQGPPADAAKPWLAAAHRRLDAMAALDAASGRAAALLAAETHPGPAVPTTAAPTAEHPATQAPPAGEAGKAQP